MSGNLLKSNWSISRRAALVAGGMLAVVTTSGCSPSIDQPDETNGVSLISLLAGITIPTTDTLGAGDPDNARWVYKVLEAGMRGGSLQTLVDLEQQLDRQVPGGSFRRATPAAQTSALEALDRALVPGPGQPGKLSAWATVKSLILRSYYTSEVGASKELRYELVPGRFEPDLPVKPGDRAWSTDANARNLSL